MDALCVFQLPHIQRDALLQVSGQGRPPSPKQDVQSTWRRLVCGMRCVVHRYPRTNLPDLGVGRSMSLGSGPPQAAERGAGRDRRERTRKK